MLLLLNVVSRCRCGGASFALSFVESDVDSHFRLFLSPMLILLLLGSCSFSLDAVFFASVAAFVVVVVFVDVLLPQVLVDDVVDVLDVCLGI